MMRNLLYRSAVPQPVPLLLDQETQLLVALWPLMVYTLQIGCVCLLNPDFDRCLCHLCVRSAVA